jgi:hypothetical protein
MLNCSKCGQELADNAKFCHKCGSPVDVPDVTTITVSEIDTVSKLIELEKEWKRKEFEYNNFEIGECPYPKPVEPQKPERESVNLLTYPKLELEPMPEFTQYLPEMPPEPVLHDAKYESKKHRLIVCRKVARVCTLISLPLVVVFPGMLILSLVWWSGLSRNLKRNEIKADDNYKFALENRQKLRDQHIAEAKSNPEYIAKSERVAQINIEKHEQYKAKCREIDLENMRIMNPINKAYDEKIREWRAGPYAEYENQLQKYNESVDNWYADRENEQQELYNQSVKAKEEFLDYVNDSHLVPIDYLKLEVLEELYQVMCQSNMSVVQAIEFYDRKKQRELTITQINKQEEARAEAEYSNKLAMQQLAATRQQNALIDMQNQIEYDKYQLLADANDIAEQTRHDMNRNDLVATIQRHNTNKYLKEITRK